MIIMVPTFKAFVLLGQKMKYKGDIELRTL